MAERDNSWDALRALLMLLGVPFHAVLPYSFDVDALVSSASPSLAAEIIGNVIHSFRMSTFFIVAGYFSAYSIARKGPRAWWQGRVSALAFPLVAGIVCFIPLQWFIKAAAYSDGSGEFWRVLGILATTPGKHWSSHLWFLIVLLEFCFLLAVCWKKIEGSLPELDRLARQTPATVLAALVVPAVLLPRLLLALSGVDQNALVIVLDGARFIEYAPLFLLGTALRLSPAGYETFTRYRVGTLLGALAAVIIYVACDLSALPSAAPLALAAKTLAGVLVSSLLLFAARRYLFRRNRIIGFLVSAAFTVYLFHHPIVAAAAYALEGTSLGPELRVFVIVAVGLAASLLVHLGISRSPRLLFVFNGRSRSQARSAM